jgi:hypothetical protein
MAKGGDLLVKESAAPPGLGVVALADPALTHWANVYRASGAGWAAWGD